MPDLALAALLIREGIPAVQFVVARAPHLDGSVFEPLAGVAAAGAGAPVVVEGQADDVLTSADVALIT